MDVAKALGGGAVALYVVCAIVIIILAVEFGFLCRHFLRHVPDSRKVEGWAKNVGHRLREFLWHVEAEDVIYSTLKCTYLGSTFLLTPRSTGLG